MDLVLAVWLLIPAFPLMCVIAVLVWLTSPGPILFRQKRPGKDGRLFDILKFRTMYDGRVEAGPVLTRSEDPRLTSIGGLLRRCKLDELPQLLNVISGHMSFVGPRPQPVKLWAQFNETPLVLKVRPGITGAATLAFRNEELILKPLSSHQVEEIYLKYLMPIKMQIDVDYLAEASWSLDARIIWDTATGFFGKTSTFPVQWTEQLSDIMEPQLPSTQASAPRYTSPGAFIRVQSAGTSAGASQNGD